MDFPRKANRRSGEFARRMRSDPTPGEKLLWWALRDRKRTYKFRRQHPIGRYILDFYCAEKSLCIEVDGATHDHSTAQTRDADRNRYLQDQGIRVIRFHERDVLRNLAGVVLAIEQELTA